jgi:predicted Zn-ribbon and HTH transcriptional regulator
MTGPEKTIAPPDRKETVRRKILSLLSGTPLSALQISARAGIPEKEVYAHLPHVKKTAGRLGKRLLVIPAECNACGFSFRKRERPDKPGRCPVCRGESISPPWFAVGPKRSS